MDSLEFCDLCFRRGKPNLCETNKGSFTKTSPLHFSVQAKLDRILARLELRARLVDRRWTCVTDSKRKEFIDSLWGIGASVHTLDDHAKVLSRLYKPEIRTLGKTVPVELSDAQSWEEFDPKSRNWIPVEISKKAKSAGTVHLGNILRRSGIDGKTYFRTNEDKDGIVLVPIEERAAYNIASILAWKITISWKSDNTGEHVFLDTNNLGIIPDEISSFLERLGTRDRKASHIMIFDTEDFELVKSTLGYIKIGFENSPAGTIIPEKKSDAAILISQIEKRRLGVLSGIIQEMGGAVSIQNDTIAISGKRGAINVSFVQDDKSAQDGTAVRVSISALSEPSRLAEILSVIKKRLGLSDLPLDSTISVWWPIITDSDLQYVVQSAISWYGSNPVLACKIIGEADKFEKVKQWHTNIKEGKVRSSLDTITLGKIIRYQQSNQMKP